MSPGVAAAGAVGRSLHRAGLLLVLLGAATLASAQVLPLAGPGAGADLTLDQEALRGFEPLSLEDIVRHLVGITVSRRGGVGSLEFLNVAGTLSGRVLLGLDGIDLGEPEFAYPRLYAVPIAIVDRVQVFWSTDPARIEIWTQRGQSTAATTQIDLGRGDLTTRVRRVQLLLPPRAWWVGARYDELLRGSQDFRPNPTTAPAGALGAYDGRGRLLALGLEPGGGESLRLVLADYFDNAHGSYAGDSEITGSTRVLGSLRWWQPLARWGLVVDLSQQAWDRTRQFVDGTQRIQESHAALGLDLTSPETAALRGVLRLRAAAVEGERLRASRTSLQRYDAELQLGGGGRLGWNGWLGVHHHTQLGSDWSGRVHLELQRASWALQVHGGRGVSFAGWGEDRAGGDDGRRPALYAAAGIRRHATRFPVGMTLFAKHVEERGQATSTLFPELGSGPRRLAGALADAGLQGQRGKLQWGVGAQYAWTPSVAGERSGLPVSQAELRGRLRLVDLFDGDLRLQLRLRWRFESKRSFKEGVALAPFSAGDAGVDVRILQHMLFYWDVQNLSDASNEVHPQVLYPGRISLVGVRVELFD